MQLAKVQKISARGERKSDCRDLESGKHFKEVCYLELSVGGAGTKFISSNTDGLNEYFRAITNALGLQQGEKIKLYNLAVNHSF